MLIIIENRTGYVKMLKCGKKYSKISYVTVLQNRYRIDLKHLKYFLYTWVAIYISLV